MEELTEDGVARLQRDLAEAKREGEISTLEADYFREAFSDAVKSMLQMEDIGWNALGADGTKGNNLATLKQLSDKLDQWTDQNPLLSRGNEIRCSYLYSSPYEIGTREAESKITPQQRNIFLRQDNQDAVFGKTALEMIEGERFRRGVAFISFDRPARRFSPVPLDNVADAYYNPENPNDIWYVKVKFTKRVWLDGETDASIIEVEEWYPTDTYTPGPNGYLKRIGDHIVNSDKRMMVDRVNMKPGETWGRADSFAAAPWALAYSAYLRDGTKVLASLADWTWKVTPKKKDGAERAAAVSKTSRGAGGKLITDAEVTSLPKGNAVDLNTGRPIAAQVASALGISVVLLLSDPGQSGAYGTAQTLTDPNSRTMRARREHSSAFLRRALKLIGVKDPEITWEKMSPGSDKEEMEILAMVLGTGLFHADEMRPAIAKIAEVNLLHDKEPDGFMLPNNQESLARKDVDADGSTVKPDGTTEQSNGQGQDNLGVGAVSQTPSTAKSTGTTTKPAN